MNSACFCNLFLEWPVKLVRPIRLYQQGWANLHCVMEKVSKHEEIAAGLIQDILTGRYRVGERLPSERDLTDLMQIAGLSERP